NRAGFYFVPWTAGAIQSERHRPAFLERSAQAEQSAHSVATARSLDRKKAELVDDTAHVFAVITVAAHHPDAHVAENMSRRDHAGMPEGGDQRPLVQRLLRTIFVGNSDAQRRTDHPDDPVSQPDNDA